MSGIGFRDESGNRRGSTDSAASPPPKRMTESRERRLLLLLAAVQFTHVMDFMVMLPMGPQLMRELDIGPVGFSALLGCYSVASGLAGLIGSTFIDRFERRWLLVASYLGFILGTLGCALAHSAPVLAVARSLCGLFGGLCGSMVMTVASDLVPPQRRAAGLGLVTTSFSVAAAFGVPLGLALAGRFAWEAPFWFLVAVSCVLCVASGLVLPKLDGHLRSGGRFGLAPTLEALGDPNARRALAFCGVLVFAHFTIIPMLAPHLIGNVGLPEARLFLIYLVGGIASLYSTPRIGRWADAFGRVRMYAVLTVFAALITLGITHARPMPVAFLALLGGSFFVFASGRFVPAQAILSLSVPPHRRGAFLSLGGCARDLMAGLTTAVGGWMVTKTPDGRIEGYDRLGWLAVASGFLSLWLASRVRNVEIGGHPAAVGQAGTGQENRSTG